MIFGITSAPSTIRFGLQLGELPAQTGTAARCGALVPDDVAGEVDEDRREGRATCPAGRLSDGRGRHSAPSFRNDPSSDRSAMPSAGLATCQRRPQTVKRDALEEGMLSQRHVTTRRLSSARISADSGSPKPPRGCKTVRNGLDNGCSAGTISRVVHGRPRRDGQMANPE